MDEFTVLALIAAGENGQVDFKRELNLSSSDEKAEFIKDLIALANSAPDFGYLVIGVGNSIHFIGIENLPEEQIQQIAYTYIEPTVKLRCELVSISNPFPLLVGVVQVQRSVRPHKVARAISRLAQDEVFVRRGSITSKASPDEIIEMRRADRKRGEAQEYVSVAETHMKAGNYEDAIMAFSKAIKDMPSYDLFLARGNAYLFALEQHQESLGDRSEYLLPAKEQLAFWKKSNSFSGNALNDLASAIRLANSMEAEKIARLKLFKFVCSRSPNTYSWDKLEQDFQWLRENLTGRELGEAVCIYVEAWDLSIDHRWKVGEEAALLMDEAVELGYIEPRVFYLRARGHMLAGNYGMAVHDLDRVASSIDQNNKEKIVEILCLRAEALSAIGRFKETHNTLQDARKIDPQSVVDYLSLAHALDDKILCQCILDYAFGERVMQEPLNVVVKYLALWQGRRNFSLVTGVQRTGLDVLEEYCPGIRGYLKEFLGKELWEAMQATKQMQLEVSLPSL